MLIIWQGIQASSKEEQTNQELKDIKIFYADYKLEKLKLIC